MGHFKLCQNAVVLYRQMPEPVQRGPSPRVQAVVALVGVELERALADCGLRATNAVCHRPDHAANGAADDGTDASAAFDAAAFTMDYLKTRAPFWKLEDDGSGGAKWVEARDGDDRAAAKW